MIAENELLTVKDFVVAVTRGYFEFTRELNFDGKIVGSMVENPNIASQVEFNSANQFELPTPYTRLSEVSAYPDAVNSNGYEALKGKKTYNAGISGPDNNPSYPYLRIQWNIVEEIKRWLGEDYYEALGANTLEQQVQLIEKGIVSITPSTYGYGYHGTVADSWSNGQGGMGSLWYDNHLEQWREYQRNPEKRFQTMSASISKK